MTKLLKRLVDRFNWIERRLQQLERRLKRLKEQVNDAGVVEP